MDPTKGFLTDDQERRYQAAERIWRGYKMYSALAFTARKGVELVGLTAATEYPVDVAEVFQRRGESVMEHCAKVAWLAASFNNNFPGFFGKIYCPADPRLDQLLTVALCHDIGEMASGDIPDDGRAAHNNKSEAEERVFQELMDNFGGFGAARMALLFHQMDDRSTQAGQGLKVLDKLDAILMQLFLEQYDLYGKTTIKPVPTEQDRHYMLKTGTPSSADCWCAHLLDLMERFSSDIKEPILALLDVAVHDVRGEGFVWWSYSSPLDDLPNEPDEEPTKELLDTTADKTS